MKGRIKMGMVGGVHEGSIGAVHYMAASLDGLIECVCGAFSSDPKKSNITGEKLFIESNRIYDTYEQMIENEKRNNEPGRIDFISIVTPNYLHFPIAKLALDSGFHVVCEKPMTMNVVEAKTLDDLSKDRNLLFATTHAYTGYPMVKEARVRVQEGCLGEIRKIIVRYQQGWLSTFVEESGHKQASWRMDPLKAGIAGSMADIGTHASNLAEYITGLGIEEVCADLSTFVNGRKLDDDGSVLVRFERGAKGIIYASQVSTGEENALAINIYGTKAGLEWSQQDPDTLVIKWPQKPSELVRKGTNYEFLSRTARAACRMPSGHPEGVIEAFANIYKNFALCLQDLSEGRKPVDEHRDFPTAYDGLRTMLFLEAIVESAKSNKKWVRLSSVG